MHALRVKIGTPTAASDATERALQRIDALLDAKPRSTQRALRKGLRKGVDHRKLWWAKGKLGVSIPPELRVLYAWRNGQHSEGGLFDRALQIASEPALLQRRAENSGGVFLSLAEMVRTGIHPAGFFDEALANQRFGGIHDYDGTVEYVPDGNDAHPTNLLPFGWFPIGERHGDDQDEDQVLDDDLVVALDDARGAVVLYEPVHEEVEGIFQLAPSLASFLEGIASSLESGTLVPPELPPPVRTRQRVDAAGLLLQELIARCLVEVVADADLAETADALRPLLRTAGHEHAVEAVVEWLLQDARIEEVFAEPEQLGVIVAEYVAEEPPRARRSAR